MSAAAWFDKASDKVPSRVYWNDGEQRFLARRVARYLIGRNVDILAEDDAALGRGMIEPLREAILVLDKTRQRHISGPSQVDWLIPTMREMVLSTRGLSQKFPATILDEPTIHPPPARYRDEKPYYAAENLDGDGGEETWVIPYGFSLVSDEHWQFVHDELRHLRRRGRRQSAALGELGTMVASLLDHVVTLEDLLLENSGKVPEEHAPPVPESAPVRTASLPLVVVAGVRDRDRRYLRDRVGESAEVVFVDPHRRTPEQVGECDWLVMTSQCPTRFKTKAAHLYAGRFSLVTGWLRAAEEIARLRERA